MPRVFEFKTKNKVNGKMEIKNLSANTADLYFYGDIVSTSYNPDDWWGGGSKEDKAPQDVADFLNELDGLTDVNIHINSGGGDVFAGVAIYNILKNNKAKKTTYVEGLAASAASIIALSGETVIIPSSAQLMIHNPWTIAMGNANDFRDTADMLDQVAKSLINIYMDNAKDGITEEQIKQMLDEETWMTGTEAAEVFNIQVDESAQVVACANSDYFAKYKHTPEKISDNKNGTDISEELVDKIANKIAEKLSGKEKERSNCNNEEVNNLKAKLALKCKL